MEKMMMKPRPLNNPPGSANSANNNLSLYKDSHVISKLRPKIHIIHVFAPEIIKTDAANFRQLVQSLTGKGEADAKRKHDDHAKNRKGFRSNEDKKQMSKKMTKQKRSGEQCSVIIKEEAQERLCSDDRDDDEKMINSTSTSFSDGFSDLDALLMR